MTSLGFRTTARLTLAALAAIAMALGLTAPAHAAPGKVVTIRGIHTIHTHAQADRWLGRTSQDFRDYVVGRSKVVQRMEKHAGGSPSCVRRAGVVVTKYDTLGYATGAEGGCGGAATLYTDYRNGERHGGAWRMVKATQDSFYCPLLKRFEVPSALVGTKCYSPKRHHEIAYHQR
jgi:hypothetical protein